MPVKEYKGEKSQSTAEQYEVKREILKLGKDQMIENVIISGCRRGGNDDGDYLIMFLDELDTENYYMHFINIGDKSVFGNKVKDTFFTLNEETGYYDIKPAFINRPIWFAKSTVEGKRWLELKWGFSGPAIEPAASKDVPESPQSVDAPAYDELEINKTLQYAMDNDEDVFGGGELLITRMNMNPSTAIKLAKAFYKAAEDSKK
jgi:hypothetical protein